MRFDPKPHNFAMGNDQRMYFTSIQGADNKLGQFLSQYI